MKYRKADRWPNWYRLTDKARERAVEAELNRLMTPTEVAEYLEEIADAAGRPLTPAEIKQILGRDGKTDRHRPTSIFTRLPTVEELREAVGEEDEEIDEDVVRARIRHGCRPHLRLVVSNDT